MQPLSAIHPAGLQPTSFLQVESRPCANAACIRRDACRRAAVHAAVAPCAAEVTMYSVAAESSSATLRWEPV